MFYTIYQITNNLNGKIYIGKHQTKNLNDGYMGSGKHLKRAIVKYGIENFKKEILFQFDNESDMNAKESELVTEEFCLREDTYNICVGGQGGFSYINANNLNDYEGKRDLDIAKLALANLIRSSLIENDELYRKELNRKISNGLKQKYQTDGHPWSGKKHSEKSKQKMSKTRNVGSTNSQFGTMWITNGQESKKIKKDDRMPDGWWIGRKINCQPKNSS